MGTLHYLIPAAVTIVIAVLLLSQRKRSKSSPANFIVALPGVDHPSEILLMAGVIEYCLDVQRGTNGGFVLGPEFWQRYSDTVDLSGIGADAHETVNLGHDENQRSQREHKLPAGPAAPTMGQGVARGYFPGHPDLPAELQSQHIAVLECFDKTPGLPVLYPASARVLPTEGWAWRNVLRHVQGDTVRLRYTYHRADGVLLADSGWHAIQHSQPLTGTDIARALWPAHGRVQAVGCEVRWSVDELHPLVPMGDDL